MKTAHKKVSIIVEAVFDEGYKAYFKEYSLKIKNFLSKYNAHIVRRQRIKETLYGNSTIDLIMIIDFDNEEIAKTVFFEKEYLEIIPLRNKIFSTFKMYLANYGEI